MIVELVGAPGSGKNTLEEVARKALQDSGMKAMLRIEAAVFCLKRTLLGRILCFFTPQEWQDRMLWSVFRRLVKLYWLKFALKNRELIRQAMALLPNQQLSRKDKQRIRELFSRNGGYYQFFRKHLQPGEVLVLNEGLIHRVTSLHSSPFDTPNPSKILDYLKLLPETDLVIWVQTSIGSCVERVVSRGGHTRFKGNDLVSFITNSHKTIEIALQSIKDLGWNIIEVNNDGELHTGMANLSRLLNKRREVHA